MSGFNGAVESGALHGYDVVDSLTSTAATAPLSANMGKTLEEHIQQSTALEVITIPSANFNSSLTVDTAKSYCHRSGRFGFLYIEAKANADIASWATLLSALPVRGVPMQTNGAYTMNLGNNVVVCNMNAEGLINTPAAISNGTNVRIAISYMCQRA